MTLKEYLSEQGLTESAFAELLGISQAAVNRYCNGIRTPQRMKLRAIVKATKGKVTANDFMGAD
jgi:predicted transcriptional regulator